MSRDGKIWFPCDSHITRDERILNAGERAGWLYIAILGHCHYHKKQGMVTRRELVSMGITAWETRLRALIKAGLIDELAPHIYYVTAWEGWHLNGQRAEYMRTWRAKRQQREGLQSVQPQEGSEDE